MKSTLYPSIPEKSVLGAILQDSSYALKTKRLALILKPSDFYYAANQAIYTAMLELDAEGTAIDLVSLLDAVESNPDVVEAGGLAYLVELTNIVPSVVNCDYYAGIVLENSRERRVRAELRRIAKNHEPLLPQLEAIVEAERKNQPQGATESTAVLIGRYLDELTEPPTNTLFTTGLPRLDTDMGGLPRGSLSIIAARTRMGKTSLALNFMLHNVSRGYKALFVSLEMTSKQILDRVAAISAGVPYGALHKHTLSTGHANAVSIALADLTTAERFNVVDGVYALPGIIAEIERVKPDIVFIDYLTKIRGEKAANKHLEVTGVIDTLKEIAPRYNCHICVLSQINRAGASQPHLENLKESGSAEESGDIVMILHRNSTPDGYDLTPDGRLVIEKHKFGQTGGIYIHFDGNTQRFTEAVNG